MRLHNTKTFALAAAAFAAIALAAPAVAQDAAAPAEAAEKEPDFKVSGSVALVSDYRFRGVSQSDNDGAIQGGLTLGHKSGMYASFWASNLAGWGTFGGPNLELDLVFGWKFPAGPVAIDVGVTTYTYPGGADITTFAEPYVKVSGTLGPVSLLGGIAYAPSQQALGNWYFTGQAYQDGLPDDPGASGDNLYVWGDIGAGIPGIPLTLKAHFGYSDGNPGLGPNGTSVAPTGSYWDWLIGADFVVGPVTLGIAWVDTSISDNSFEYLALQPNFSDADGKPISNSTVVFSITGAF
jgi:uncharacterized protein (TIGR02001 family)